MLRFVQHLSTRDLTLYAANHSRTEFLDHPGIGVFFGDGIRCFKSMHTRGGETITRIIFRMSEYKHQINTRVP